MHSSTRAQPINSFHPTNALDPYYLFPDGSVHRDINDYLEKVSKLFHTAMHSLSGVEKIKLVKFLGDTPYADIFEAIKGVGAYGRFFLHRSRTMGATNLTFPVATAYEPPTTAQKVAARLNSTVQPDFKVIPVDQIVRELLPQAIWRCSELDACDHFESDIEYKIEKTVGITKDQIRHRERF